MDEPRVKPDYPSLDDPDSQPPTPDVPSGSPYAEPDVAGDPEADPVEAEADDLEAGEPDQPEADPGPRLDNEPEEIRAVDSELWCNDPFINRLVREADIDNYRVEKATKAELLVYLAHSERIRRAEQEGGYFGDRLVAFGKRITGFGRSKVYQVRQLVEVQQAILEKCHSDRGLAIASGRRYEYPRWRTAWGWYFKKEKQEAQEVRAANDEPDKPDDDRDGLSRDIARDLLAEELELKNERIAALEELLRTQERDAAERIAAAEERAMAGAEAALSSAEAVANPKPAASNRAADQDQAAAQDEVVPPTQRRAEPADAVADPEVVQLRQERDALREENNQLKLELARLRLPQEVSSPAETAAQTEPEAANPAAKPPEAPEGYKHHYNNTSGLIDGYTPNKKRPGRPKVWPLTTPVADLPHDDG